MILLTQQNWFLARRNGVLWAACTVMFVLGLYCRFESPEALPAAPGIGFAYAFFVAQYVGDAGLTGRLDAQIISGASRLSIFLSMWLTCSTGCVLILLAMLAGDVAAGFDSVSWDHYIPAVAGLILNALACAAWFVMISLGCAGRRAGRSLLALILCTVVCLAVAVGSGVVLNALDQPPYDLYYAPDGRGVYDSYERVDFAGDFALYDASLFEQVPNPGYVPEPQRSVLTALARLLPTAQCQFLADTANTAPEADSPGELSAVFLSSILLSIAGCLSGILLFRQRELD